ncbi:MAG: response regulator transcription factor [Chloroflexota bacterium]
MATTILVVEDDPEMARSLSKALVSSGYHVSIAESGSDARSVIGQIDPDLILLDLGLPDTDGLVLTNAFKAITNAPIIICSARQQQVDRVLGLKLGADDFIAKPFELEELEARVEAVLRRASRVHAVVPTPSDQIRVDDLFILLSRATVTLDDKPVHLTPTEFRLLVALARRPDEVLSRETLGQLVWGYKDMGTDHLIDVHIGRLRLKLRRVSSSGPGILTVRGKGYMIATAPSNLAPREESGSPGSDGGLPSA